MNSINETSYREKNYTDTLDTLNKYRQLAGITRLADITKLDYTGIPVFTAIRPRAKSLSTSQGKGLTIQAAKCSALMEAIEVYFAENLLPEITNKSVHELTAYDTPIIHPNNLTNAVRYMNDDMKMNWITADAVLSRKRIIAPFAEFSLNSYLDEVLIYSPNTTGLAGGNTYEEALCHSLLEIIERESVHEPVEIINTKNIILDKVCEFFNYKIIHKKNSYELPSFEVLIKSKNPFDNQVIFKGNGCHFNKNIALNRAITEAVQSRVTIIAGSRDDIIDTKYDNAEIDWTIKAKNYDFNELVDYSDFDIEKGLNMLYEKTKNLDQDIIVYKYFEKDICIVKSKILPVGFIENE